jgi:chemotaxis protein CheX
MPFQIDIREKFLLVSLEDNMSGDDDALFKQRLDYELLKTERSHILFDCRNLKIFNDKILRQMTVYARQLKQKNENGGVRLFGMPPKVIADLRNRGLDYVLPMNKSFKGALLASGLESPKPLDTAVINPFIAATLKTLEVQAKLKAKFEKPYLKKDDETENLGDVSGIIPLKAETFEGTLTVSLSETVFARLYETMLDEKLTQITRETVDLVGELSNIIMGQAKVELNSSGYDIQMARPTCVWGKDHQMKQLEASTCIVIPFECEVGRFYLEISTRCFSMQALREAA